MILVLRFTPISTFNNGRQLPSATIQRGVDPVCIFHHHYRSEMLLPDSRKAKSWVGRLLYDFGRGKI